MAGGRATAGGVTYQAQVAAYCSVLVLAEHHAARLPAFAADAYPVSVWCETAEALDDIELRFSHGKRLLMQAKRGLGLQRGENSQLGKACGQLVAAAEDDTELAIVVDPTSKSTVTKDLAELLDTLRTQPFDTPLRKTHLSKRLARAQDVLVEHLRRAWHIRYRKTATTFELRRLIARTRILIIDVEGNGSEAREAESLLRVSVVADAAGAPGAWTHLLKVSLELAKRSSGIGRPQLHRALLDEGIALRVAPTLHADAHQLIASAQRTLRDLRQLSHIQLGTEALQIDRELPEVIHAAAEQGSLVVVGEPGIGKSGALHQMALAAQDRGQTVVVLAAEEFDSATQRGLADELRLEHDVAEVIAGWPVTGLLVIDGLDAGSDKTRRALATLMRRAAEDAPHWHIVASIRTFDLRNDPTLPIQFPIIPRAPIDQVWTDPEFRTVRHVRAGRLTDDEVDQLAVAAPDLHHLVTAAPNRMRDLARVPFNLRLLAQLTETVAPDELQRIDSQVELLEAYWRERVLQPVTSRDLRERLLRDLCEHALTARRLTIPRSIIRDGPIQLVEHLQEVLGNEVLIERTLSEGGVDGDHLAFAHNVLFDYAVARLLLRSPGQLLERLTTDPRLLLRARPSIELHMRWLWNQDTARCAFWQQALSLAGSNDIGELPKTIAPAVAVDLARTLTDFDHLLAALHHNAPAADNATGHAVGALTASTPSRQLLTQDVPWPELLKALTDRLTAARMWIAQRLMLDLADQLPGSSDRARHTLGEASRTLLAAALDAPGSSRATQRIVQFAIEVVRKTFATDPTASEALLRRLLEPARVRNDGHWQLFRLADDIGAVAEIAPAFVGDVYRAAFGYHETSDEATAMLPSQLMTLRSSRKQDYDLARHLMAEQYHHLLSAHPAIAIDVLDDAVSHMPKVERYQDTPPRVMRFQIARRRPGVRLDSSYVWDRPGGHDYTENMLEALEKRLTALAAEDAQADVDAVATEILSGTRNAALWRVLLRVAARHPNCFIGFLSDLLARPRIHLQRDLEHPAGQALAALHPTLDMPQRKAVEQAVMALPQQVEPALRDLTERRRDELLSTLQLDLIADAAARRRRVELDNAEEPFTARAPPFDFEIGWGGPVTDAEILRGDGIDADSPANAAILELAQPIGEFATTHLNEAPNARQRRAITGKLRPLWTVLQDEPVDVDDRVLDLTWGKLAAAAECLARRPVGLTPSTGPLVRDILLAASEHPEPTRLSQPLEEFDKHPHWGSHTPRIEAAEGLTSLAQDARWACGEVTDAVQRLSRDAVATVRFAVSRRAASLLHTSPDLAWSIVEERVAHDPSAAVVQVMLDEHGPLRYLANRDQERALSALRAMVAHEQRRRAPRDELLKAAYSFLAAFAVWRDASLGRRSVEALLKDPVRHEHALTAVIAQLRDATIHGGSACDAEAHAIRRRALDLYGDIATWATNTMAEAETAHGPDRSTWPTAMIERWDGAARLADAVGDQLFFASGVFQERQGQAPDDRHANPQQRLRLYHESYPILEQLSAMGLPQLAHRLVEMLAGCTDADPTGVFNLVTNAIRAGGRYGYQYESMAAGQTTKLIRRYLAEHRELFDDDQRAQQLIDILELFVGAGWPEALRLVYGLDDLYR